LSEQLIISPSQIGLRLDHFLVRCCPNHSRSALARLVRTGDVRVNNRFVKAGYRLQAKDGISIRFPVPETSELQAQQMDFTVLFEDRDILIIDKPAGLVVHPGDGNHTGTLVNGLLYRYSSLPGNDNVRPGIVHRLDKDTSGIMVVA